MSTLEFVTRIVARRKVKCISDLGALVCKQLAPEVRAELWRTAPTLQNPRRLHLTMELLYRQLGRECPRTLLLPLLRFLVLLTPIKELRWDEECSIADR